MMKWGRKDSHSSATYLISHVFPISWLKKFKRNKGNVQPGTEQAKRKGEVNEMTRSLSMPVEFKEGRFYSGTDDLYWRLSFGEDRVDDFDSSRSRSWEGNRVQSYDTILEIKDVEKNQYKVKKEETVISKDVQEKYHPKGMKGREQTFKAATRCARDDQEQRHLKKQQSGLRSRQKDLYETKQLKTVKIRDELQKSRVLDCRRKWNIFCPSCNVMVFKENSEIDDLDVEDANAYPEEEFRSEQKKINKIISRNEHRRLSVHLRKPVRIKGRKTNRKISSLTGRNAGKTECKMRETEFMKKEKMMKRIIKDIDVEAEAKTAFDSYAVQKSSYDPQQDFRDSMLEMIIEKGIKQPDELEELLVCYLTHNCVDYHDLIIKVFRQVWFDLNQVYFAAAW